MTDEKSDATGRKISSTPSPWLSNVILGVVCALVIGIYAWSAEPGFLELASPRANGSYYNLLVQGFQAGQLNVKREAPSGLAQLKNPYDSAANLPYVWDRNHLCYEMSYYNGKLYLYFGVTPALVLFWPYAMLTGHYLGATSAVVIFFSCGFLIAAWLLCAVWRRYFPEIGVWIMALCLAAMGLATGVLEFLSSCDVYEIAKSCGFAFAMAALACIWRALHKPNREMIWLVLASLAYGLAVGSRPSLLYGAIILLIPAAKAWYEEAKPDSWRWISLLFAAAIPISLVGIGLMIYNGMRFDNPFEFGWHYQLTNPSQDPTVQQFSWHYLWFNFLFYFLEPMRWTGHFPFLHDMPRPSLPPGYAGIGAPYSGILWDYPIVWLALAVFFAFNNDAKKNRLALSWFIATVFLLFAISALTICLFLIASSRYQFDFLPVLIILALIGIFSLERTLRDASLWKYVTRTVWCLLLVHSILFSALAAVDAHAGANFIAGNSLVNQGRLDEAVEHFQKSVALEPDMTSYRISLGTTDYRAGKTPEAIEQFQKVLEIEPNLAEAEFDLGRSYLQIGQINEAFAHLQKALSIDPNVVTADDAAEINNLAWSFATNPDAAKRNGPLAVQLAEGACKMTHDQTTIMVGTLAAAYAEAGRFDEAIATAKKACALATQSNDEKLLKNNQKLLALYLQHQAYHESQTSSLN